MLRTEPFSINWVALSNNKECTTTFALQEDAELFIKNMDGLWGQYRVTEFNFELKFSEAEIEAYAKLLESVKRNAMRLEKWARDRTNNNFANSELYPCEVCGGNHANHYCCEHCNHNKHRCLYCGELLGHKDSFSSCYILMQWEENYALLPSLE